MTNRPGQALNRARKLLLAGAAVAALAGPVAIGVWIGVGNPAAIHAQSPAADAPGPASAAQIAQPEPARPPDAAAQDAAAPAAPGKYPNRRLLAMLFDLDTMTSDDQSRARQSAIEFVHGMQPADLVAVMAVDNGKVSVVEDFTDDRAALESDIRKLGGDGNGSVPRAAPRLSSLETAVRLLGAVPDKKAVMYFATGVEQARAEEPAQLQKVVDAAVKSNVAFYPVDASGIIPQSPAGGRSMGLQSAPAGISQDEYDRRRGYAQANFGSPSSAMGRTYIRYGPPDQIEDRRSNAQDPSQIWRYNYLENFRGNVEFEFRLGSRPNGVRINWPPPLATYVGVPGAAATPAQDLNREGHGRGGPAAAHSVAGLPGGDATFQTYPAGELQTLTVPLGSLSGRVDISGTIKSLSNTSSTGFGAGFVRDSLQVSGSTYQTSFTLEAGSYVCTLIVREQATGQTYGETINFEVK
jgi:hypothetical protein